MNLERVMSNLVMKVAFREELCSIKLFVVLVKVCFTGTYYGAWLFVVLLAAWRDTAICSELRLEVIRNLVSKGNYKEKDNFVKLNNIQRYVPGFWI